MKFFKGTFAFIGLVSCFISAPTAQAADPNAYCFNQIPGPGTACARISRGLPPTSLGVYGDMKPVKVEKLHSLHLGEVLRLTAAPNSGSVENAFNLALHNTGWKHFDSTIVNRVEKKEPWCNGAGTKTELTLVKIDMFYHPQSQTVATMLVTENTEHFRGGACTVNNENNLAAKLISLDSETTPPLDVPMEWPDPLP